MWRLNGLVRHLADADSRDGSSHHTHDNDAPHAISAKLNPVFFHVHIFIN